MGVYAANLDALTAAAPLPLDRTVLIADFEPDERDLLRLFSGMPRVQLLPAPPELPCPDVAYHTFRTGTNPLAWDDDTEESLRGVDTAVFLLPERDVRGQTVLRLRRLGIRRILLVEKGGFRATSPLILAARRKLETLGRRVLGWLGVVPDRLTEETCRRLLALAPPRRVVDPDGPLRIAYFLNSLNSGGAERQACYSAIGQKRRGHDVRVLVRQSLIGTDAHYLPLLHAHGIETIRVGTRSRSPLSETCVSPSLPPELRDVVADLSGELLAAPVDVLHCFVDDANVPGVLAAALTGTPGTVLSFRNGNPSHFPGLHRSWMRPVYRAVRDRSGVCLSANSEMGARDYEQWLTLLHNSVPIVRNAFIPPSRPVPAQVARLRHELGLTHGTPIVVGVFRLEAEKRPLVFLDCVRQLRDLIPEVRVLLVGVGSLEAPVRVAVDRLGLSETVRLLGQRSDVPALLALGDVLLLTSDWEGTPNVVLEAQYAGCVPVATAAGGTREALADGRTGVLVGRDDLGGLVRVIAVLLRDPVKRRRLATAGAAFVAERFSADALDAGNERLYRTALAGGIAQARSVTHGPRD